MKIGSAQQEFCSAENEVESGLKCINGQRTQKGNGANLEEVICCQMGEPTRGTSDLAGSLFGAFIKGENSLDKVADMMVELPE